MRRHSAMFLAEVHRAPAIGVNSGKIRRQEATMRLVGCAIILFGLGCAGLGGSGGPNAGEDPGDDSGQGPGTDPDEDPDQDPQDETACGPWLPIDVAGAWWSYDGFGSSETATWEVFALGQDDTVWLVETDGSAEYEGYESFQWLHTSTYLCDADGVWLLEGEYHSSGILEYDGQLYETHSTVTYLDPYLVRPRELSLGAAWANEYTYEVSTGGDTYEYAGLVTLAVVDEATIEVPAGEFDAFEVELTASAEGSTTTYREWVASGIGTVATETSELVDYDL